MSTKALQKKGFAWLMLAMFATLTLSVRPAIAKDTVTFAYGIDPSYELFLYPLRTGKIKSDLIDVKPTTLAVPALIQATATRQFDVVHGPAIGILNLLKQGLPLKILASGLRYKDGNVAQSIWVRSDSPIKTAADLKGKTIGVPSINATTVQLVQIALWKQTGLKNALQGGDLKFVELPAAALRGALESGKIDAAQFIFLQAYQADQGQQFRRVFDSSPIIHRLLGAEPVPSFLLGYGDRIDAHPQDYKEFARLMQASADYVAAHLDEVIAAVAKTTGQDPAFFRTAYNNYSAFPGNLTQADIAGTGQLWKQAKDFGLVDFTEPVNQVVWSGVNVR